MIVITHHHEIEDIADVVYNVDKKEGISIVETSETYSGNDFKKTEFFK